MPFLGMTGAFRDVISSAASVKHCLGHSGSYTRKYHCQMLAVMYIESSKTEMQIYFEISSRYFALVKSF